VAGLNTGGQRFAGDNGAADPRIAAVLAAYGAGQESEQAVLTALAGSRLLVPLVERPAEAAQVTETCATDAHDDGCDHRAARELAFPTLIGRDGRPALLAFTSLAALVRWRPDARPVPTPAGQVWGTAIGESCAVVIDVAGPVPIAVDGARLAALAAGDPAPAPQDDPDLQADVAAALASLPLAAGGLGSSGPGSTGPGLSGPSVVGAELAAGPDGTDLAVRLLIRLAPRGPQDTKDPQATQAATQQAVQEAVQQAVQQAAEAIAGRLASRLRRGIQFSAAPAPHPSAATPVTAAPAVSPAPVPSRPHG
jgi:type III secretion system (T3SS) SseB-like protein